MGLVPISQHPFIKGIVAGNQPLAQPKGAIQRGSNLVYTSRGALDVADGSEVIHAPGGVIGSGLGKVMAAFLFRPIGVPNYYLTLQKAQFSLSNPKNLVATLAAGGSLHNGQQYFYEVTALDGAGGETVVSNEVTATPSGGNLSVLLTWNVVPNAVAYNVYRSISTGTEIFLVGSPTAVLPVPQVAPGTLSVSFTDDGTTSFFASAANATWTTAIVGGSPQTTAILTVFFPVTLAAGQPIIVSGFTGGAAFLNGNRTVATVIDSAHLTIVIAGSNGSGSGTSGSVQSGTPPLVDTTQQTLLYKMPTIVGSNPTFPVSYGNANVVALFPADPPFIDGGGGGGPGGGGGRGGGGSGGGPGGNSTQTPSGGVPGNVTVIPQFKQFSNRAVIALGNGFPMQLYSDATGSPVNPATVAPISAITVDAFGVVTVTTSIPHGLSAAQVGANVIIAGVTVSAYNFVGPTIQIVSTTQYKVRNLSAIGSGASSGGTSTTTAIPIISTYTPSFPKWTASTPFVVGDIIVPATQPSNAIFLTCFQAGNTGTVEPTWPTGGSASIGNQVSETGAPAGTPGVIWTVTGLLNSTAPPPPGAGHIEIYANILWAFDTSPTNTANGLDGPTALRASAVGNPNSWNPVNQAFIDKDDGTEGMGLAKFTITALGIPPEGTLIAFKNYSPYQILGVFGASDFAIQPVSSNMGCTAPRTINFVPGFGIMRMTHLGLATFNGVKDELVSEQIRPYLFPMNDSTFQDITVVDANNISLSWAAQTSNPPMYCVLAPIGSSGGQLTRIFCYDLVFKAWGTVDVPFPLSFIGQFQTNVANPVTIIGGFSDGCLSRWQAGDIQWDTAGSGARSPSNVAWSFRTNRVASQEVDQRIYCRRLIVSGNNSGAAGAITCTAYGSGKVLQTLTFTVPANGEWSIDMPIGFSDRDFDVVVSSSIHGDVHGCTYEIEPRPMGVVIGSGI